jgi:hypothetical protein
LKLFKVFANTRYDPPITAAKFVTIETRDPMVQPREGEISRPSGIEEMSPCIERFIASVTGLG